MARLGRKIRAMADGGSELHSMLPPWPVAAPSRQGAVTRAGAWHGLSRGHLDLGCCDQAMLPGHIRRILDTDTARSVRPGKSLCPPPPCAEPVCRAIAPCRWLAWRLSRLVGPGPVPHLPRHPQRGLSQPSQADGERRIDPVRHCSGPPNQGQRQLWIEHFF